MNNNSFFSKNYRLFFPLNQELMGGTQLQCND
jgi:hypothetical protein